MKKKLTGLAKAEKVWNEQPYLEKLLFLMNTLKISEDEADSLAKLQYDKLALPYRNHIYLFLD